MHRSPIAMFCFNRPIHTRHVLEALARCKFADQHDLYVFIDGPRTEQERELTDAVAVLMEALPFRSTHVYRSNANRGLFAAITEGVSRTLEQHPRVIVLEDDLVPHPAFLEYMNDALDRYQLDQRVACIHGYALPISGLPEFYFLRGGDCWGWATWRDRWELFCPDPAELIRKLIERDALDFYMDSQGTTSLRLLCDRARKRNQSWAILWHASLWLAGRLTLNPGTSFVRNIGNDGSGTHSGTSSRFDAPSRNGYSGLPEIAVSNDASAASKTSAFYDSSSGPLGSLVNLGKRILAKRLARKLARTPR